MSKIAPNFIFIFYTETLRVLRHLSLCLCCFKKKQFLHFPLVGVKALPDDTKSVIRLFPLETVSINNEARNSKH